MTPNLSPRERMLVAMMNGMPDQVPVAPDMSNMIPCKLTGKPFWEVYYYNEPPLWEAYLNAVKFYGFDGWFTEGDMQYQWPGERYRAIEELRKTAERWIIRYRGRMDGIPYTTETTYYIADTPTPTEKMIKDIASQWDLLEKVFAEPVGYNSEKLKQQRAAVGELASFGVSLPYPGFHAWFSLFEGGLEALTFAYYDRPDLISWMRDMHEAQVLRQMEMVIAERPDFILLGASGTITLSSPALARQLCLPTIKKMTAMAKAAGIPTMIHSCGKERILVKWCAEETDLNCINPLEIPPMGDCSLAEIKQAHGNRMALMGNLHTSQTMLFGSVIDVRKAALQAMLDGGVGGGFILSTGDQLGRDTPDVNIHEMISVAREFGQYPLNVERIQSEINKIG